MQPGELGRFLRNRREAVSPSDVGLPSGPRRRTPGLRRAEVATLAGVSVDYLTRLEQGRDQHPSAQVLAAIADVLRLDDDDMTHLRMLAAISSTPELCPTMVAAARTVRPTVRALLERLEPAPAYVANAPGELLAWTIAFEALMAPLGALDGDPPNLVRYVMLDQRARTTYPEWATVADRVVADLRATNRPGEPIAEALVAELSASGGAEFTARWDSQPTAPKRAGAQRLHHPTVGELRLDYEVLQLPDTDDQRLVVLLPRDEATEQALDRLAGRQPGALRAVRAG